LHGTGSVLKTILWGDMITKVCASEGANDTELGRYIRSISGTRHSEPRIVTEYGSVITKLHTPKANHLILIKTIDKKFKAKNYQITSKVLYEGMVFDSEMATAVKARNNHAVQFVETVAGFKFGCIMYYVYSRKKDRLYAATRKYEDAGPCLAGFCPHIREIKET